MGLHTKYSTGEIFTATFNGTKADQPVLEIVESSLTEKITDLGFTAIFSYKVTIALTAKGVRHEFTATSKYSNHGMELLPTSVKIAVETAVADLYRQVKAVL